MSTYKRYYNYISKHHRVGYGISFGLSLCLLIILIAVICIQKDVNDDVIFRKELIDHREQTKHLWIFTDWMKRKSKTNILKSKSDTMKMIMLQYDSLYWAIDDYQRSLNNLEMKINSCQDDIRQETNNIINKFNGSISVWLVILGLLCGITPLLLSFYNWTHDAEFIKNISLSIDKKERDISLKIQEYQNIVKELQQLKTSLYDDINKEIDRINNDYINTKNYYDILQLYLHILSITSKSKFQHSIHKIPIVESLLYSLINDSIVYIDYKKKESEIVLEKEILRCIDAISEGLKHLQPFFNNRRRTRYISKTIEKLQNIEEKIYNGEFIVIEDWNSVEILLREIRTTIIIK